MYVYISYISMYLCIYIIYMEICIAIYVLYIMYTYIASFCCCKFGAALTGKTFDRLNSIPFVHS